MDINELLKEILIAVIAVAVPILVKYATEWFATNINKLTQNINDIDLRNAINEAAAAISTAVSNVSQTYVDDLKKAGNFDDAAKQTAASSALVKSEALISDAAKKLLTTTYGSLEDYLKTKIEAEVKAQKTA